MLRASLETQLKEEASAFKDPSSTKESPVATPDNRKSKTENYSSDIPDEILTTLARLARMPTYQIQRQSRLDTDLGLDSLTRLDLLLVLEARLGETIPDALLANLETVGDVVKLIETFDADAQKSRRSGEVPAPLQTGDHFEKNSKAEFRQVPPWYARAFRSLITNIYRRLFFVAVLRA